MSTTQKAFIENVKATEVEVCPTLILEKQLQDTLQLLSHIQNTEVLTGSETEERARSLVDHLAEEVSNFEALIRKRLRPWQRRAEVRQELDRIWRPHVPSTDPREQLRNLLSAFALYERQTAQAIVSLRRSGDLESAQLLIGIRPGIELCLWFVEVYLESFASHASVSELPEWSGVVGG